jgi:predicted metal-dependent hydrolase
MPKRSIGPRSALALVLAPLVEWLFGAPRRGRRSAPRRRPARRPDAEETQRRNELARRVTALAEHWEPILGVSAASWRIRRMRTRWGSCNVRARRIWLNVALVYRPLECL